MVTVVYAPPAWTPPAPALATLSARRRFVADRFRRIWAIVEEIAAHPGQSRRELADRFHLSERQVQADLNIIRSDMRLPLVRDRGYRFQTEGVPTGSEVVPNLRDAQLLVLTLSHARTIPRDQLSALMAKLPAMFPGHLEPLVARTVQGMQRTGEGGRVFTAIADALLAGRWVKLSYPNGSAALPDSLGAEPIIRPELLLPYLNGWYVLGAIPKRNRTVMLDLDAVEAVTMAEVPADGR